MSRFCRVCGTVELEKQKQLCVDCKRENKLQRNRVYRKINKERLREYDRARDSRGSRRVSPRKRQCGPCTEAHKANAREWQKNNPEKVLMHKAAYRERNKLKIREGALTYDQERRKTLSDHYVKKLIRISRDGLKTADIPQSLVEIKRVELKLKRKIKENKNGQCK